MELVGCIVLMTTLMAHPNTVFFGLTSIVFRHDKHYIVGLPKKELPLECGKSRDTAVNMHHLIIEKSLKKKGQWDSFYQAVKEY